MAVVHVIEDERVLCRSLAEALEADGHAVRASATAAAGLAAAQSDAPDVAVIDLRLPDGSGLDLLRALRELPDPPAVLVMTAYGSVRDAVEAMRRGALDYLQKPLDLDALRLVVKRALDDRRRDLELGYLREREASPAQAYVASNDPGVAGFFDAIARLREARLAPGRRPPILITGETGTGKGVFARRLHALLGGGAFIELNCAAVPESLVEAELFGHERGIFTDAKSARRGLFAAAEGGALLLDEIGQLEPRVQAKLLKAIEDRRVRRVGSTAETAVDVHVIAATNADLEAAVRTGSFRSDLLHRLSVLPFEIPPLRRRRADIAPLARHFCERFSEQYGGGVRTLTAQVESLLTDYDWPGNVRELRNVLERAVLLSPAGPLAAELVAGVLRPARAGDAPAAVHLPEGGLSFEALERDLLRQALERAGGNRVRAAELLGLSAETVRYRAKKFELE